MRLDEIICFCHLHLLHVYLNLNYRKPGISTSVSWRGVVGENWVNWPVGLNGRPHLCSI